MRSVYFNSWKIDRELQKLMQCIEGSVTLITLYYSTPPSSPEYAVKLWRFWWTPNRWYTMLPRHRAEFWLRLRVPDRSNLQVLRVRFDEPQLRQRTTLERLPVASTENPSASHSYRRCDESTRSPLEVPGLDLYFVRLWLGRTFIRLTRTLGHFAVLTFCIIQ